MARYEYKVVPSPTKGQKIKGVKTPEGRFALTVEAILNEMGASGWEYQRAELLPSEERSGLTGSTTNWRNVLVFRRPVDAEDQPFQPRVLDTPSSAPPPYVAAPPVRTETQDAAVAPVASPVSDPMAAPSGTDEAEHADDAFSRPGDPTR